MQMSIEESLVERSPRRRVMHVTSGYFPTLGGGELYNKKLADQAARRFDVRVLTIADRETSERDASGVSIRRFTGKSVLHHRVIPPGKLSAEIDAFEPDLIQFNGPNIQDIYGLRLARAKGVPVTALYYADFRQDNVVSRASTQIYRFGVLSQIDAVFTISMAYRDTLVSRGIPAAKVTNLGVGVDTDVFHVEPRDRLKNRLLFVGRLDTNHSYKRVDLLLEALRALATQHPSLSLHVVGSGNLRAEHEQLSRRMGIENRVTFLGDVDDESLRKEYQEAAVFVLPSPTSSEGFGLVTVEAMACGASVVTSEAAGASEVVRRSGLGALWDGSDASALAEAIGKALEMQAADSSIAERAHEFARREYSWEAVGARLARVYDDLLENRTARAK